MSYELVPILFKKVFLYLRRSEEDDKRQIRSLEDQEADCRVLAERLGLEVVAVFIEKKSARRPHNRTQFTQMLKEISYKSPSRRRADAILAWHPNRLSRNAEESGLLIQRIDDKLIKSLYFPAYSFHNDTSGIEHLSLEFVRAKGYSDQLSDVVSRGSQRREKTGAMVYPVQYGYIKKRESDDPALCSLFPIPHPEEFKVLKRAIELAIEGSSTRFIHSCLVDEFLHLKIRVPSRSTIDELLKKKFLFGLWVINKGQENERIIDLNQITLPDRTQFTPACSIAEFNQIQILRKCSTHRAKRKHDNPLPNMVSCGYCESRMYPNWRKIKTKGGKKKIQLGYECQSLNSISQKCPQSRVKADILFEAIEQQLSKHVAIVDEQSYERYIYAANKFLSKRRSQKKSETSTRNNRLRKLEQDREKLVNQKISLVEQGLYDIDTKEHIEKQLSKNRETAESISGDLGQPREGYDQNIRDFKNFLELIENLPHYWANADSAQKAKIVKKFVSNLKLKDKEVLSIKGFKGLYSPQIEGFPKVVGESVSNLNLLFERLWAMIDTPEDMVKVQEFVKLNELLKSVIKPVYVIS